MVVNSPEIGTSLKESSDLITLAKDPKETLPQQDLLDDEYSENPKIEILKPLPIKNDGSWGFEEKSKKVTLQLERQYEYYSRTRGLGINSERVTLLQGVVDKMTTGTDTVARVVIVNKSKDPNAFVYPDGTIFVTQALLNRLDSLDEVAAVLGHELGHLILRTSELRSKSNNDLEKFGIGWIHEAASDTKSRELMEKAGYNSLSFSSAIRKIQGSERGFEHMSGLTRASQSVGSHFFVDSATSHQEEIPIPESLHQPYKKTNLEIIKESFDKDGKIADINLFGSNIEKLHPQDLDEIYQECWEKRGRDYQPLKLLNNLILMRLARAGFARSESILMLFTHPKTDLGSNAILGDVEFFDTPEKLNEIVEALEKFESSDSYERMFQLIFGRDIPQRTSSGVFKIRDLLGTYLYDPTVSPQEKGIPVTADSLLSIIQKTNGIPLKSQYYEGKKPASSTDLLVKYINKTYFTKDKPIPTEDLTKIESFLTKAKVMGIQVDTNIFIKNYYIREKNRALLDAHGNCQAVMEICRRLFDIEIDESGFQMEIIDSAFDSIEQERNDQYKAIALGKLLKTLQEHFRNERLTDDQKEEYIRVIDERISRIEFSRSWSILGDLDRLNNADPGHEEIVNIENSSPEARKALFKFNLRAIVAMSMFKADGDEFYRYLNKSMRELEEGLEACGIDTNRMSRVMLINLCRDLFGQDSELRMIGSSHGYARVETGKQFEHIDKLTIKDYGRFFRLPLIAKIAAKEETVSCTNLGELLSYTKTYLSRLDFDRAADKSLNLFGDDVLSLIIGRRITANLSEILSRGVQDSELDVLYEFTSLYYPTSIEKDQILRGVNKKYLESPGVSLDQKIDYLERFVDSVGYEGISIVVEQIEDIEIYRSFRARMGKKLLSYLEGNSKVTKLAFADNASAQITKNFKELLATCERDPKLMESVSTRIARKWMEEVFGSNSEVRPIYDKASGKFILSDYGRQIFRTVNDVFAKLHSLSSIEKFAIAHKALFETGGAFSSEENRKILAESVVSSLSLAKGFISEVLSTACVEGDAEYVGFPAANMIASMMFNALDIKAIDLADVEDAYIYTDPQSYSGTRLGKEFTESDILRMLSSTTREISLFGAKARKDPTSVTAGMALESDRLYHEVTERLNKLVVTQESKAVEESAKDYQIDPSIEAVIRGVEATGALGIRALQLSSQFLTFSEPVNRRLSETLDANPGMDRLMFWENLNLRTQENPEVEEFLKRIKLGKYLGGGSLQTTYAAVYTDKNGADRQIIIKRKNPSVEGLLKRAYITSHKVLDTVIETSKSRESRSFAKTGKVLIALAQDWCIADLNDKNYIEHDDLFRQTVQKFNESSGTDMFYAPERVFTEMKVKAEGLATGRTLNKVLKDGSVSPEAKKELVARLGQFFLFQLRGNLFIDEDGKKFLLVHSDPHVGNYMADISDQEHPKIGVIDRSLYLKLSEKDVAVLEKLIGNSRPTDFVQSFTDLILDKNKDRGLERLKSTAKVYAAIAREYRSQMVSGKYNKFALLNSILNEFSNQGKHIPLELRLMIRNITAMQELMKRFGLELK